MQETDDDAESTHESDPVDAALAASGALFALMTRSISDALDVVTLPQYAVLSALSDGPHTLDELAGHRDVAASSLDGTVQGLVETGWVIEIPPRAIPRREGTYELTAHGAQLIAQGVARRRADMAGILDSLSHHERQSLAHAFAVFASAADDDSFSEDT
ncbi:MarR family transcriptional regulator [soil metagenome]